MPTSFLTNTNESSSTSVEASTALSFKFYASTDPVSGREFVKVMVVGSPKGVIKIIHTLYNRGFAEVTEWSPPVPTKNPGEVMSVMRRCVLLD
ncbi:MAG TPA: hypothetical protein DCE56_13070 [Cyanobacteria bacterium UBA8553]|nr:hypothetical protein [Cyanobacteria bacterium UBA8553]HAJ60921.1 hypothetical protein [Cyanobacteria bacterium UBA8543]